MATGLSDTIAARAIEAFQESKDRTARLLERLTTAGETLDAEIRSAAVAGLNAANREYDELIKQLRTATGLRNGTKTYKRQYDTTRKLADAAALVEQAPAAAPIKKQKRKSPHMSAAARKAVSERMKKYWAKRRKAAR